MAFELAEEGVARRLLSPERSKPWLKLSFILTMQKRNACLETARRQFVSSHLDARRDALEKLYDAFDRVKTLEPGKDKRDQVAGLLDRVGLVNFEQRSPRPVGAVNDWSLTPSPERPRREHAARVCRRTPV